MNPFLDSDFTKRINQTLPDDHPAKEKQRLTSLQAMVEPALLWFFDTHTNLGQGRTTLLAHVTIKLCIKYGQVHVADISTFLTHGDRIGSSLIYFVETIFKIQKANYPNYKFSFNKSNNMLKLEGVRNE